MKPVTDHRFCIFFLLTQVLNQVGVISGNDITPEAALAKLSYVLSKDDWDLSTKRMVNIHKH